MSNDIELGMIDTIIISRSLKKEAQATMRKIERLEKEKEETWVIDNLRQDLKLINRNIAKFDNRFTA